MKRPLLIALTLSLIACGQPGPLESTQLAARNMYSAALSQNSELALIGAAYHGGSLWRLSDKERLFDWNHRKDEHTDITVADFSPDGQWALTTDSKTLVLWDTQSGAGERFWTAPADVLALDLGANGNLALLGLADRTAVIYAAKRGGILRTLQHAERVNSVALSLVGKRAITGADDRSAIVWDTESGKSLHSYTHKDPVQLVALSPDGRRALSAAQYDSVVIWDTESGELIWDMPLKKGWLQRGMSFSSAVFSADAAWLLTGRVDGVVELWSLQDRTRIYEWRLPKRKAFSPQSPGVIALGFGREGNRFYAVSSDGFVHQLGY